MGFGCQRTRLTCPGAHPLSWHRGRGRGRRSHRRAWWGRSWASKPPSTASGSAHDTQGGEPVERAAKFTLDETKDR